MMLRVKTKGNKEMQNRKNNHSLAISRGICYHNIQRCQVLEKALGGLVVTNRVLCQVAEHFFADVSEDSPIYSTNNMVEYHIANNHLRNEETTLCG